MIGTHLNRGYGTFREVFRSQWHRHVQYQCTYMVSATGFFFSFQGKKALRGGISWFSEALIANLYQ